MSESEQRTLRTILAGIPGILAMKNKKLAYEVVNPQFCQFLAKGPNEIIGQTDDDLFPKAEATAAAKEQKSVVSSGIPRRAELQFTGKEGPRWFDVSLSAVMDENGDPAGVMIAGHDITVFKQREAAVSGAEDRVNKAEAGAAASVEKLRQVHDEAKALEAAAQTVQEHLKQREKQLAQTLKQTGLLEDQLKEANEAAQGHQEQLQAAQAALAQAEARARDAEAKAGALEARMKEVEQELAQAAAAANDAQKHAAALETQRTDAAALARQLADKLA